MQEETAIISLDEFVKRSKEIYEANKVTQYKDEGNEPISLQELEEKTGSIPIVTEGVFNLSEVVSDNNGLQLENTADYEKLDAEIKKTNEFLMTLR